MSRVSIRLTQEDIDKLKEIFVNAFCSMCQPSLLDELVEKLIEQVDIAIAFYLFESDHSELQSVNVKRQAKRLMQTALTLNNGLTSLGHNVRANLNEWLEIYIGDHANKVLERLSGDLELFTAGLKIICFDVQATPLNDYFSYIDRQLQKFNLSEQDKRKVQTEILEVTGPILLPKREQLDEGREVRRYYEGKGLKTKHNERT